MPAAYGFDAYCTTDQYSSHNGYLSKPHMRPAPNNSANTVCHHANDCTMNKPEMPMHTRYVNACPFHVIKPLRCNVMQNADDCTAMNALYPKSIAFSPTR